MNAARVEKAKPILRNRLRSSTGLGARRSHQINIPENSRPAAMVMMPAVSGSSEKPYIRPTSERQYRTEPPTSILSSLASPASRFTPNQSRPMETMASGMAIKKMLRQPKFWVSAPPSTGPRERPV
jgi:hypothetical protein